MRFAPTELYVVVGVYSIIRHSRMMTPEFDVLPKPKAALEPNTYAYESEPMVKPTGFREYDARWLFQKEINLMGVQALGPWPRHPDP